MNWFRRILLIITLGLFISGFFYEYGSLSGQAGFGFLFLILFSYYTHNDRIKQLGEKLK